MLGGQTHISLGFLSSASKTKISPFFITSFCKKGEAFVNSSFPGLGTSAINAGGQGRHRQWRGTLLKRRGTESKEGWEWWRQHLSTNSEVRAVPARCSLSCAGTSQIGSSVLYLLRQAANVTRKSKLIKEGQE